MNSSNYFATIVINSFAVFHEDKQCKIETIDLKINNNRNLRVPEMQGSKLTYVR